MKLILFCLQFFLHHQSFKGTKNSHTKSLRWIHPRIVDTSLIFPHGTSQEGNGFIKKYSLRHLSAVLLKKQIQRQDSQKQGHCSVEDAAASLYLALQKAKLGPSFGIKNKRNNQKNIFGKIHKLQKHLRQRQQHNLSSPSSVNCGKNNDIVGDDLVSRNYQRPLVCLGPSEWINDHILSFQNAAHALSCESMFSSSVKALYSWLKHNCNKDNRRPFFIWSKLCFCSDGNKTGSNKEINKKVDEIMVRLLFLFRLYLIIASDLIQQAILIHLNNIYIFQFKRSPQNLQ